MLDVAAKIAADRLRPGAAAGAADIVTAYLFHVPPRLTQGAHRRLTRTNDIADRFVGLIRHPDRGQFTGAVQLGKVDRVPPVGLDPLAWLSRDQRWRDDGVLGLLPCSRTSPRKPASANATAIVSLCTSSPTYVIGFAMTRRRLDFRSERVAPALAEMAWLVERTLRETA